MSFRKKKLLLRICLSACAAILVLALASALVVPKYADGVVEGAFVAEYYDDKPDHDVLFIGDCEVYENFSPAVLWREYGINSYIRGSAEQYIWQSYYLLEDALRYETPKVVIFNLQSLQFNESQNEAYNRMSIEGMRWSPSKIGAIKASMLPDEHFIDYVFPILRYHSRWNELTAEDFKYMFKKPSVSFNGYYMRTDVKPAENVPEGKPLADYSFGDKAWEYMNKIVDLCKRKGIQLVLIKAPSLYPYWYPEWEKQAEDYAASKGVPYFNFLEMGDEIGIDYNTDTYDGGLHLNLSGAEKMSRWMGNYLSSELGLSDRRSEPELAAAWMPKLAAYDEAAKE